MKKDLLTIIQQPLGLDYQIRQMSKFYNDTYKWSLYADFRSGKTITQLCDVSGITDKPLRSWFKQFDAELAQVNALTIEEFCRENRRNREALQREQLEASLLQSIILDSNPEIFRISCARRLLEKYGPNQSMPIAGDQKI